MNITDAIAGLGAGARFTVFGFPEHVFVRRRVDLEVEVFDQTSYRVTDDEIFIRARARIVITCPVGANAFVMLETADF